MASDRTDPGPDRSSGWDVARVDAGAQQLGYVRATGGERTIVLLHGWPESSWAWRKIIPLLAEYDVIAFDLPGVGNSSPSHRGYDKRSLASSICAGLRTLGVSEQVAIVGHDVGAMVGYAFARMFPASTASLIVLDQPLPGIDGWDEYFHAYASWHIGFHRDVFGSTGLAELVLAGSETAYFRRHIDRFAVHAAAIAERDVKRYVRAYSPIERLRAGFEMFRTLPIDVEANATDGSLVAVPTLLVYGQYSQATLATTVMHGLIERGSVDVSATVIDDCGHWIAEEQPVRTAEVIREFVAGGW